MKYLYRESPETHQYQKSELPKKKTKTRGKETKAYSVTAERVEIRKWGNHQKLASNVHPSLYIKLTETQKKPLGPQPHICKDWLIYFTFFF